MDNCKWIKEHLSNDLVLNCPKKIKELRIIHEVLEATHHTVDGTNQHNIIVEKLKGKLVADLGCKDCDYNKSI